MAEEPHTQHPLDRLDQVEDRLDQIEARWPFLARVASFLLGGGILVWQTVVEQEDRLWLIAAALGLMGTPIARFFADRAGVDR